MDGRPRSKSFRLAGNESLEVAVQPRRASELEPEAMDLDVVWQDAHLLVVDNPAGLVVHPGAGHATGTLVHGLLAHEAEGGEDPERPGIVHRLDRDTSGLLVVARSDEAHRALQEAIRARAVMREYVALVRGRPRSRAGRIEAPVGRDRRDPTRMSIDSAAPRDAVTHFELEELLPRHALLAVRLETGRTHQIRVHLEAIGLPVAGDPVYRGPASGADEAHLGLERQFLHARRLSFDHPVTGERLDVSSPLPDDLEDALSKARQLP